MSRDDPQPGETWQHRRTKTLARIDNRLRTTVNVRRKLNGRKWSRIGSWPLFQFLLCYEFVSAPEEASQ